jgi:hypothetical protein
METNMANSGALSKLILAAALTGNIAAHAEEPENTTARSQTMISTDTPAYRIIFQGRPHCWDSSLTTRTCVQTNIVQMPKQSSARAIFTDSAQSSSSTAHSVAMPLTSELGTFAETSITVAHSLLGVPYKTELKTDYIALPDFKIN